MVGNIDLSKVKQGDVYLTKDRRKVTYKFKNDVGSYFFQIEGEVGIFKYNQIGMFYYADYDNLNLVEQIK